MTRSWGHRSLLAAWAALGALVGSALMPGDVYADAPALQVAPLEYRDQLTAGVAKTGYIDVSNPGDSTVTIRTSVKGFRQADDAGRLTFFDDPQLASGIKLDLAEFELGPREAVRMPFTVAPSKLPGGSVYAVIFFRTVPPPQQSGTSYVAESANIGTLLELENGPAGKHVGSITNLHVPWLQLGDGMSGSVRFKNSATAPRASGFRPELQWTWVPGSGRHAISSGLVTPGAEREFGFSTPGSFVGIWPLQVVDRDSGASRLVLVAACTGWWRLALPVLMALVFVAWWRRRELRRWLVGFVAIMKRFGVQRRKATTPAPKRQHVLDLRRAPMAESGRVNGAEPRESSELEVDSNKPSPGATETNIPDSGDHEPKSSSAENNKDEDTSSATDKAPSNNEPTPAAKEGRSNSK